MIKPLDSANFWGSQITLWASFALLTRYTWLNVYPPSWTWIIVYMTLGLVFSSVLAIAYQQLLIKPRYWQLIAALLLSLFMGLAWRSSFNAVEYHILESANNQFRFWGYFHNGKSAVMQLLIWSLGYWLLHYHKQLKDQAEREQQLILDSKEAQLKMLRYQIAPHFLFNVLSGIDTLLLKQKPQQARAMLSKLSGYLRQTLSSEQSTVLTLDEELSLCRRYLEIEQMRFDDKLHLNWQVPQQLPDCQLPNGLLLPILENALKHGGLKHAEQAKIDVTLQIDESALQIVVGNNLGTSDVAKEGFGIGLTNTKERIKRFFGDKAQLQTERMNNYFIARLTIQR